MLLTSPTVMSPTNGSFSGSLEDTFVADPRRRGSYEEGGTDRSTYPLRLWDCLHEDVKDQEAYIRESGDGKVPHYVVVSQVWGEIREHLSFPSVSWPVPISNRDKWEAIVGFCKENNVRWLWMDILCIDQSDNEEAKLEKAREIPNMSFYYSNAFACLVVPTDWERFAEAHRKLMDIDESIIQRPGAKSEADIRTLWEGIPLISEVVTNAWFERVWTYQELMLGERHVLLDGQELHVDRLSAIVRFYLWVLRRKQLRRPEGCPEYDFVKPDDELVVYHNWEGHDKGWQMKREIRERGHANILMLVVYNSEKLSTHAIDRIFGLYGMLAEEDKVDIDPASLTQGSSSSTPGGGVQETKALRFLWRQVIDKAIKAGRMWPLLNDVMTDADRPGRNWMPVVTTSGHWYGMDSGLHLETLSSSHPPHNTYPVFISPTGLDLAVRFVGRITHTSKAIGAGGGEMAGCVMYIYAFGRMGHDTAPAVRQLTDALGRAPELAQASAGDVAKLQDAMRAAFGQPTMEECLYVFSAAGLMQLVTYGGMGSGGISTWNHRVVVVQPAGGERGVVTIAWVHHSKSPGAGCYVMDVTSGAVEHVTRWVIANEVSPQVFSKIGTAETTQLINVADEPIYVTLD
ncbi:hypothetical protein CONPUDRAFT_138638 [Coniophora puteana RWD-64-598 SS2]|uniref:Heterokaryon incompatibility domain-containing protein n=1 Tax=Coniophora puteana (strain RWD-64-598) TaxID=741705 RepID=A0A5M3MI33_CONPW|nr:uncharacterized protein CONPUDRAFT_138638 [Coniophora puteana RWD-64-598 SS2]EIW78305.1 hypothetical protein CONPUDRAFT_138638 [Coniophora puteana RWD-64-598 SS2]